MIFVRFGWFRATAKPAKSEESVMRGQT
jgi:predicted secreted protein